MEAGCALIGAVALGAMPNPGGVGWALLGWMLLTLAILDWRHFWLPDALTLPLAFLGLTIGLWSTDVALIDRIIGAVAGYGALLGISGGYRLFRGREGLGLGDVKLLGALGAWFGWQARSEEHTSELQSLIRISYAVFCLKKKNTIHHIVAPLLVFI